MSGPRPSASLRRLVCRMAGQQSGLRDAPAQCAASGLGDRRQCRDLGDAQGAVGERHAGFDGAAGVASSRCGPQGQASWAAVGPEQVRRFAGSPVRKDSQQIAI